ncbi:hypothetical protein Tco_1475238 [Tanacetum coccineum]
MIMGESNLMMGLTLVLVISLANSSCTTKFLILLAELYCSVILRRRNTTTATTTSTTVNNHHPQPSSLTNLGVLSAPRNLLYPTLAGNVAGAGELAGDIEKQQNLEVISDGYDRKSISGRKDELGLFYISNPVFDDGENGRRKMGATPFETPETSPSRLETEGDDEEEEEIMSVTPPLTPMKKLPAAVVDGGGVSSTSSSGTPCTSSFSW